MSTRNLDKLLQPGSIALVGASDRPGSIGAVIAHNLFTAGFAGEIWPVNPNAKRSRAVAPTPASTISPRRPTWR